MPVIQWLEWPFNTEEEIYEKMRPGRRGMTECSEGNLNAVRIAIGTILHANSIILID